MPIDLRFAADSTVKWFRSGKNAALFFATILLLGTATGFAWKLMRETRFSENASLNCVQAQPKDEFYRVTEFFLLTCLYCEKMESYLPAIKDGVVRRHLVMSYSQEEMARFIFALDKMSRTDLIHAAEMDVLDAKSVFIYDSDDGQAFASKHALDTEKMRQLHYSTDADKFIAETRSMQVACHIRAVPTLMRAGELISPSSAGGFDEAVKKILPPPPVISD